MRTFLATLILLSGVAGTPALAADDTPAQPANTKAVPESCVDVEVNGIRTPSYDCLSTQMAPAQPGGPRPNPALSSGWVANAPSNQLGMFNQSSFSNRMGSNFGKSAFPQRPPTSPPVSPLMMGR